MHDLPRSCRVSESFDFRRVRHRLRLEPKRSGSVLVETRQHSPDPASRGESPAISPSSASMVADLPAAGAASAAEEDEGPT